jgi:4-amino-4-deoxy-L-arabinose transferase-like glycosyltransferase
MKINKLFFVFILSLLLFLFWAHAFPVTDTVESNYALTAKEMVATSDWISPRIYGKFWYDKPIMIYWLLALAMKLIGYSDLVVRIIPAVAGALGVTLIYWFVAKLRGKRAGLIAAALLMTTLQYFIISKLIITDSILFTLNAAALVFFYLGYANQNATKRWYLLMYPCLGLAVLTKGPVGVILPGLVILIFIAWQKNWAELSRLKLGMGTLLFLITALPWYGIMYLQHGQAFINTFLGIHNYLRATISEHPRDNVFYYYILLFLVSTLPWTGMVSGAIVDGWRKCRRRQDLPLFLLIWVGVFFLFYQSMATKYPTYTFPILFPLIVLTAFYLEDSLEQNKFKADWILFGPLVIWNCILIFAGLRFLTGALLGIFVVLNFSALLVLTFRGWWSKGQNRLWLLLGGVIFSYLLFALMVVPKIGNDRSGKQLARSLAPYTGYQIGTYKFYSTAAVYYSGNLLTKLESPEKTHFYRHPSFSWYAKYIMPVATLPEFLARPGGPKMIIIKRSGWSQFRTEADGVPLEKVAQNATYLFYRVRAIKAKQ